MTPHLQLQEKIASLDAALKEQNPRMPVLLQEIHRTLKNDPAIVTVMTPEEISIIVSGLKVHTATQIVTTTKSPSAASKKALSKVSTSDLGF